jgi:hypothetical protein
MSDMLSGWPAPEPRCAACEYAEDGTTLRICPACLAPRGPSCCASAVPGEHRKGCDAASWCAHERRQQFWDRCEDCRGFIRSPAPPPSGAMAHHCPGCGTELFCQDDAALRAALRSAEGGCTRLLAERNAAKAEVVSRGVEITRLAIESEERLEDADGWKARADVSEAEVERYDQKDRQKTAEINLLVPENRQLAAALAQKTEECERLEASEAAAWLSNAANVVVVRERDQGLAVIARERVRADAAEAEVERLTKANATFRRRLAHWKAKAGEGK